MFNQVVEQFQVQINELSFWMSISMLTELDTSEEIIIIIITAIKSEKLSDSLIFNKDWKELCLFVTKLCLKLSENADWFLTDRNKINYVMSYLEDDAACTMNSFF